MRIGTDINGLWKNHQKGKRYRHLRAKNNKINDFKKFLKIDQKKRQGILTLPSFIDYF
jgi:hypothetical protein